ncbi:hypothetical protein PHLCEN_2v1013 [Hermanssonia centrifuga]|uniref:Uncharacterized protein n=1 Tax=Hermanssonia centrifuga TaxID=98765 RepID=A0A2R6S4C1_9APHY|nr:hypothetical protein PHLCEN_2v1013 [Hermanssonia centrifuga]
MTISPKFWDLGHKLFKSTQETFPVPSISGDVFDPTFLALAELPRNRTTKALAPLSALSTLTPLRGHLTAILASSFFHLFDEFSPEPGSIGIFGEHRARPEKGIRIEVAGMNTHSLMRLFCHCTESWKTLWERYVFGFEGKVKVEAFLEDIEREDFTAVEPEGTSKFYMMTWSVTRL